MKLHRLAEYPHCELRCVFELELDIPDSVLTYKWEREHEGRKEVLINETSTSVKLNKTSTSVKFEPLKYENEGKYTCTVCLRSDFVNGEKHYKSESEDVTLEGMFMTALIIVVPLN